MGRRRWMVSMGVVLASGCISMPGFSGGDGDADASSAIDSGSSNDAADGVAVRTLTFEGGAGQLEDVVIPVRLDPACIDYGSAGAGGADIRFGKDSTELAHEVDTWIPGAESLVWVRLDSVTAGTNTLSLFFGEVAPRATTDAGVWVDYEAVWHLSGSTVADATGKGFTGTANNATPEQGLFGQSYRFSSGQRSDIEITNGGQLIGGRNTASIEMWLYPDYASDAAWPAGGNDVDEFLTFGLSASPRPFEDFNFFRDGTEDTGTGTMTGRIHEEGVSALIGGDIRNQEWTHFGWSHGGFNRAVLGERTLLDGISLGSIEATTGALRLGSSGGFSGRLDEVRVAHRERSNAYFRFLSSTAAPGFVTCTAQ